jgi:hypothetical protein
MEIEIPLNRFPQTKDGIEEIVKMLAPKIRDLWRTERQDQRSDDLVAIITVATNTVKLQPRQRIFDTLRNIDPEYAMLDLLCNKVSVPRGVVAVWAIVGFPDGRNGLGTCRLMSS